MLINGKDKLARDIEELKKCNTSSLNKTNDAITIVKKINVISGDARMGVESNNIEALLVGTGYIDNTGDGEYLGKVSTGVTANSSCSVKTKKGLRSAAHSEIYYIITAKLTKPTGDGFSKIGYYGNEDGFWLGFTQDAGTQKFCIATRRNSVDTIIYCENFNQQSVFASIDWTKLQSFKVRMSSSLSDIEFQLLCENGCWTTFHQIEIVNEENELPISRYTLPLAIEANNGTTSEEVCIQVLETIAGIIDGVLEGGGMASDRHFSTNHITTITGGSYNNKILMAIRNPDTYQGYLISSAKENFTQFVIDYINFVFEGQNKQGQLKLLLIDNAYNTGGNFTQIDTDNSKGLVSTNATYNLSTAKEIFSFPVAKSGTAIVSENLQKLEAEIRPGLDLVFTYTSTTTLDVEISNSVRYTEQW